jgi:CheY-like chemotaxis protein
MFGLLLCDDLIFTSRVTGTAAALALTVRAAKTQAQLLDFARQTPPCCVILDLHTPGLVIDAMTNELSALDPKPMIVAYGSHVDTATLKAARDAGCDVVWPRSKFVEELASAMPGWFQAKESAS